MNPTIPPIDPRADASVRAAAHREERTNALGIVCVAAQMLGAFVAGGWAAASAADANSMSPYGAVALVVALFIAHGAVRVLGWVALLFELPGVVRQVTQSPPPANLRLRAGRFWDIAELVVHVVIFLLGALLAATVVWMGADHAAFLPLALRFIGAAAALSLLTRRVLDVLT